MKFWVLMFLDKIISKSNSKNISNGGTGKTGVPPLEYSETEVPESTGFPVPRFPPL